MEARETATKIINFKSTTTKTRLGLSGLNASNNFTIWNHYINLSTLWLVVKFVIQSTESLKCCFVVDWTQSVANL